MGVYIKGKLPTEFNGITMKEAVYWADIYLQDNPCDRMWDAIRALRDFCECVTDEAIEVTEPHGRLIDADEALHHFTLNMNWSDEDGDPIHDWEERESILKGFVDGVSTVIEAEGE